MEDKLTLMISVCMMVAVFVSSVEVVVVEINPTSLWLENMTLPSHDDDHVVDMYVAKEMGYDDEVDRVVIGTGDGNDRLLKANTTYAVYIRFVSLEVRHTSLTNHAPLWKERGVVSSMTSLPSID